MLIDGQEPQVPQYYIVNREIPVDVVWQTLHLTPVYTAVVEDWLDFERAQSYCDRVVMTDNQAAIDAINVGPYMKFGDAAFIDAVYADGRRESLSHNA